MIFLIVFFLCIVFLFSIRWFVVSKIDNFSREFSAKLKATHSVYSYESFLNDLFFGLLPIWLVKFSLLVFPSIIITKRKEYHSLLIQSLNDLVNAINAVDALQNPFIFNYSMLNSTIDTFVTLPDFKKEFFLYFFLVDYAYKTGRIASKKAFIENIKFVEKSYNNQFEHERKSKQKLDRDRLYEWANHYTQKEQHPLLISLFFDFNISNLNIILEYSNLEFNKAYALSEAMKRNKPSFSMTDFLSMIYDDSGCINLLLIKKQYKWLSKQLHPDSGGKNIHMQDLNSLVYKIKKQYF